MDKVSYSFHWIWSKRYLKSWNPNTIFFLISFDRDGDGFILVYSVKSRGTFERVERFHRQVLRVKDFDTVPLILVGNRQPQSTAREVSVEEGYHMGRRLRCRFIEVDARSGLNVESAFYSVVRLIRARREQVGLAIILYSLSYGTMIYREITSLQN